MGDKPPFFKYSTADELAKKQAELSRLANGLLKQTTLGIFSADEVARLEGAAGVLRGFKAKVEHEKEKAAREEKRRIDAIDADAAVAESLLRTQVAALSLADQFRLATSNEDGGGNWPYGSYAGALADLNRLGIARTLQQLQAGLAQWVQQAGRSLALRAHAGFNPEPVSATAVQQTIHRAINGDGAIHEAVGLDQLVARVEELQAIEAAGNVVSLFPSAQ